MLGSLFGTTSNETDRTELLIFLTPHVIHDPDGARVMTDDLLKRLDRVRIAIDSAKMKE